MNIGIEIEFTGVTVKQVAYALESLWGKPYTELKQKKHPERLEYSILDRNDDMWVVSEDRSIRPSRGIEILSETDYEYMCEIVSPVLNSKDLSMLYTVLSTLNNIGAIVNETCGCHIHIDNKGDINWLNNLFIKALKEQFSILDLCGTSIRRKNLCRPYPIGFIEKYSNSKPKNQDELISFLYKELGRGKGPEIYPNCTRTYWFNLDSIIRHNTIEFRQFNSTLSPLVIQTYVDFIKKFTGNTDK